MRKMRTQPRLLCADLVEVEWIDESGRTRRVAANLEDISQGGACLQMEAPVPCGALVKLSHPKANFQGKVRYCVFREIGYFFGVEFEPGSEWSRQQFRPKHLFDPRRLGRTRVKQPSGGQPGDPNVQ